MSLASIFGNGLSGLQAAQTGLRVVSQNVANLNTPGYTRAEVRLEAQTLGAAAGGVEVTSIRRAVDQFLSATALKSAAAEGAAVIRSELLDRAQRAFGDPNGSGTIFSSIDNMFAELTNLAAAPSNALRRTSAIEAVRDFLARAGEVGTAIEGIRSETEYQLAHQAQSASTLLERISAMNQQIRVTRASGGDSTSAENNQSQLIDELSSLIDIRVTHLDAGGVNIRTGVGALLVGDTAATISYTPASTQFGAAGRLYLLDSNGAAHPFEEMVREGSIAGLIKARDTDLTAISDALASLVAGTAAAINSAHNDNSSVPAPTSLIGHNTGLVSTDALGFTGRAVIAMASPAGSLTRHVAIDFSAGTYSVDGGAAVSFGGPTATIAQFVTGLNTALGGAATLSFSGGKLSINSAGSNGIVVQQDATTPALRKVNGFAQFFGLNDLIVRDQPYFYQTGMSATDSHNLNPGGALAFRLVDENGRTVLERSVAVTGTSWSDQIAALNAPGTGIGGFGTFTMDGGGRISATAASGLRFEVTSDTTVRGDTTLSMSSLFGIDRYSRAGRALDMRVNPVIASSPGKLALAKPDLAVAIGSIILESGDGLGAAALAGVGARPVGFAGFNGFSGTIKAYAAYLGGETARRAEEASDRRDGAAAVGTAATERRSSLEGVNLDDELIKMTTFQQSYAASSRVIQAAKEMFDILLTLK